MTAKFLIELINELIQIFAGLMLGVLWTINIVICALGTGTGVYLLFGSTPFAGVLLVLLSAYAGWFLWSLRHMPAPGLSVPTR